MRKFEETVACVTGSSRGIGAAVVRHLGNKGVQIFSCARDHEALQQVAGGSNNIHPSRVDIRDEQEVADWMETVRSQAGRLDVLINNAGVLGPRKPLDQTDPDEWRETLDINVTGTFLVTREAYPLLRQANRPLVINVSSSVGRKGRANWGAYSVSKFAIEGLAQVAAYEFQDDAGCVVTLNPGGTATDMRTKAYPEEDPSTLPSPERVAQTVGLLVRTLTPEQNGNRYDSRSLFDLVESALEGAGLPTAGG